MPKVKWRTPRPLWPAAMRGGDRHGRFRRPEVLRFKTDTFMEDLQTLLEEKTETLENYVARKEDWRQEGVGWLENTAPEGTPVFDPRIPMKLYQPAHMRFYLVAAELVCQVRGLPDKKIDTKQQESTSFVMRQLFPKNDQVLNPLNPASFSEYGWDGTKWIFLTEPHSVHKEEELNALFPVTYAHENKNCARNRLLAGMIPAAKRETYESAGRSGNDNDAVSGFPAPGDDELSNPNMVFYRARILENLREAVKAAAPILDAAGDPVIVNRKEKRKLPDTLFYDIVAYALLDLNALLDRYTDTSGVTDRLKELQVGGSNWDALRINVAEHAKDLDEGLRDESGNRLKAGGEAQVYSLALDTLSIQDLLEQIAALFGEVDPPASGATGDNVFRTEMKKLMNGAERTDSLPSLFPDAPDPVQIGTGSLYVTRCVYKRPKCAPSESAQLVSPPSQPFQLASFFDTDAPIRPVRIAMPGDVSLASLRKSPRGVTILLSQELRKQVDRFKEVKFKNLDDGEVDEGPLPPLGSICMLSIPIIAICALIILMILVYLLNIFFWWLPLFRVCFPIGKIPKFKLPI